MKALDVLTSKADWAVEEADALSFLSRLPDGCLHASVCSPPYHGLRDYGLPTLSWPEVSYRPMPGLPPVTVPAMSCCLGLEPDLTAYVGHLLVVFREVRRALRADGTCWVNLGDTYAGSSMTGGKNSLEGAEKRANRMFARPGAVPGSGGQQDGQRNRDGVHAPGIAPKNLLMVPARFALAMQADGWVLRSEIVWSKPAPMPSSVRDRPTVSHEMVYLFAPGPQYAYDQEADKEQALWEATATWGRAREASPTDKRENPRGASRPTPAAQGTGRNLWTVWHQDPDAGDLALAETVWTVGREPLKEKHYAAFPSALPARCVRLGTSEYGCCPGCGTGWVRVVERERKPTRPGVASKVYAAPPVDPDSPVRRHAGDVCGNRDPQRHCTRKEMIGWRPACGCGRTDTVPAVVLDCFAGSGTTGVACRRLGRRFVGCEPSGSYAELARVRVATALREGVKSKAPAPSGELFPGFGGGDL